MVLCNNTLVAFAITSNRTKKKKTSSRNESKRCIIRHTVDWNICAIVIVKFLVPSKLINKKLSPKYDLMTSLFPYCLTAIVNRRHLRVETAAVDNRNVSSVNHGTGICRGKHILCRRNVREVASNYVNWSRQTIVSVHYLLPTNCKMKAILRRIFTKQQKYNTSYLSLHRQSWRDIKA